MLSKYLISVVILPLFCYFLFPEIKHRKLFLGKMMWSQKVILINWICIHNLMSGDTRFKRFILLHVLVDLYRCHKKSIVNTC